MTTDRSLRTAARLIERLGPDLTARDARARRIDRARRVQDAWLRGLRSPLGGSPLPLRSDRPGR